MRVNYFYLWHWSKIGFVYPLMANGEKNVLVINTNHNEKNDINFEALKKLSKLQNVVVVDNGFKSFFLDVLYRIIVFPFKRKAGNEEVIFFLDGFRGYLPLKIANIGNPDQINLYEEGESIYIKGALLRELPVTGFTSRVVRLIKRLLFVKRISLCDMDNFYVRDVDRFKLAIDIGSDKLNNSIMKVNVVDGLKKLSSQDKSLLKNIFFSKTDVNIDVDRSAIVLTQPLYFYDICTKNETKEMFDCQIKKLQSENFRVYLKLHPKEQEDIYLQEGVTRIRGDFPFELLALCGVEFEKGVTYNSTAINCDLVKEKIILSLDGGL